MIVVVRRFSDVRIYETETAPTIEMGSGSGGNNLPMIMEIHETDDISRQMESSISRRSDVDTPHVRWNRGR